ncbi:MAG: hypothetical protein LBH80_05970 [Prevotellaceae bacterium]|nr:hypothetical protein [Prevotellaceae bacterium]
MKKINKVYIGLIIGILLPVLFIWVYLEQYYPADLPAWEIIKQLFPGRMLGKILLLSIFPDLLLTFIFYKTDSFKIAQGAMFAAMLLFVGCIFML